MKSIRWVRERKCFVLSDGTPSEGGHGTDKFKVETALDVSLSSLRRALARQADFSVPSVAALPPAETFDHHRAYWNSLGDENSPSYRAELTLLSDETFLSNALYFILTPQGHLHLHFVVEGVAVIDRDTVIDITRRLFSRPSDVIQLLSYGEDEYGPSWSFEMVCDPTGRTVGSVWNSYKLLCFFLTTLPDDLVRTSDGVQHALRLGRPDALIDIPESSWLEVKSGDYLLSSATEKIKLAQDVVRFANADGGLLVLGLRTSRVAGVDIISQVTPLPLPARPVGRYRSIIDRHVYPLVRGLDIFSVPCGKGEILVINIPSQSDNDKPFMVHGNLGSITDNKVKGEFISIGQRRGDGAEYVSGPAVHGLLANRRIQQIE